MLHSPPPFMTLEMPSPPPSPQTTAEDGAPTLSRGAPTRTTAGANFDVEGGLFYSKGFAASRPLKHTDSSSFQTPPAATQSSSSCSPCSTPVQERSQPQLSAGDPPPPLRSARSTPVDLGCVCSSCGARQHPPPLRSARSSPADVSSGRPQPPRKNRSRPSSYPEHRVQGTAQPHPSSASNRPATPTSAGARDLPWQRQVPLLKSVSHAHIATSRLQHQQPVGVAPGNSNGGRHCPTPSIGMPPPAWRAPGSSLDRPVVLENCTPLPPYRTCHCGNAKVAGGEDSSTYCGTYDGEGITAEGLSWRRLHMSRAKLKATATTSELLSGFAMVAMVELQINEPTKVPEWLFVMFSVCTTVLVAVHIFALMISTYLLPNIDAVSKLQVQELVGESPHERMRGFIELAWAFSTVLGLFLFLVEVAILCWVKFWDYSFTAAWAATVIVVPVLIVFVAFAVHFYHKLVVHKCESSVADIQELEAIKQQLDSATIGHSKV